MSSQLKGCSIIGVAWHTFSERNREIEWRGNPRSPQREAAGEFESEREAHERAFRHARFAHEGERLAIGAEQDVLRGGDPMGQRAGGGAGPMVMRNRVAANLRLLTRLCRLSPRRHGLRVRVWMRVH